MRRMFFFSVFIFAVFFTSDCYCWPVFKQDSSMFAFVGRRLPNLVVRNVDDNPKDSIRTSDSIGKWIILDFWNKHCGSCIASFPKMDKIGKDFSGKLDLIMVGNLDKKKDIVKLYDKLKSRFNYEFTMAFDSTLFKEMDVYSSPYIVICDPAGVVRAVTNEVDSTSLANLMAGKNVSFAKAFRSHEKQFQFKFDGDRPFLVNGNGGYDTSFSFRSILLPYGRESLIYYSGFDDFKKSGQFAQIGIYLDRLYNLAYLKRSDWSYGDSLYGRYLSHPMVLTNDRTLVRLDTSLKNKPLYSYCLNLPDSFRTVNKLLSVMRNDLENYFGYSVRDTVTTTTVYTLKVKNLDRLGKCKSKYKVSENIGLSNGPLEFHNASIDYLLETIALRNDQSMIFCNKTNIDYGLDIKLDCILTDMVELKQQFNLYGLELVEETNPVKCLLLFKE